MATSIDFTPPQYDILHEQGQTVVLPFELSANGSLINMTGWTVSFKVRPSPSSAKVLLTGTLTDATAINMAWTTKNLGRFKVVLPASATSSISFPKNEDVYQAVYDIEAIEPDGTVWKVVKGNWTMSREVAR